MAAIKSPPPVLLLLAAFSARRDALDWARHQATAAFGPLALESEFFSFTDTAYYEPTMGGPLIKQFFAFERRIDPGTLAQIKHLTNDWERQFAERPGGAPENAPTARPLNLDPGYLDLAKLVLASTKDHAHRIYLGAGIHAEVTLQYRLKSGWEPQPWTFLDYRRADYHAFFDRCREYLRAAARGDRRIESPGSRAGGEGRGG